MSGDRQIKVTILGDASGAQKALGTVGDHAESTGKRISSAFGGLKGILGEVAGGMLAPFQGALTGISEAFDKAGEKGKLTFAKLGTYAAAGGVAIAAVGAGIEKLGSPLEASKKQLETAITDTGHSADEFSGQIAKAGKQLENYAFSTKDTNQALQTLTQATGDPAIALKYIGEVADIAKAKHISLDAAASGLAKTFAGSSKFMKAFGLDMTKAGDNSKALAKDQAALDAAIAKQEAAQRKLMDLEALQSQKHKLTLADHIALRNAKDNLTTATAVFTAAQQKEDAAKTISISKTQAFADNMQLLGDRTKGQAAASVDTFAGKLDVLKTKLVDGAAAMGAKYGPALTGVGAGIAMLGGAMDAGAAIMSKFKMAQEASTVATDAMAASDDALGVSEGIALGPIVLIVAGIAALAVGIIYAYNHVKAFRDIVDEAGRIIGQVADFIGEHWKAAVQILLVVVLGPLGLAIDFVMNHFTGFKEVAVTVWNVVSTVVSTAWGIVKPILGFLVGIIKDDIVANFTALKLGAQAVWPIVSDAISGMWKIVEAPVTAFKAVLDGIINAFNTIVGLAGKVGGAVSGALSHLPGAGLAKSLGIPGFATGGIVPGPLNAPRLILAHGGENVVTRAQQSSGMGGLAGGGNAYHMEFNVNGNASPDDVMMALRRMELLHG